MGDVSLSLSLQKIAGLLLKYKQVTNFERGVVVIQTQVKSAREGPDVYPSHRPGLFQQEHVTAVSAQALALVAFPNPKLFSDKIHAKAKELLRRYEKSMTQPDVTFSLDLRFHLDETFFTKNEKNYHTVSEIVLSLYHYAFYAPGGSERKTPSLEDVNFIWEIASTHPLNPFLSEAKPDAATGFYRDRNGYKAPFPHVYHLLRSDVFADVVETAKKVSDPDSPLGPEVEVKTPKKQLPLKRPLSVPDTPLKKGKKKTTPKPFAPPAPPATLLQDLMEKAPSDVEEVDVEEEGEEDVVFGSQRD